MHTPSKWTNLVKSFGSFVAVDHVSFQVSARRDLRLPGPERRGQIDHHPHPLRAADADLGQGVGARLRCGHAAGRDPPATSATCRRSSRCTTISPWKRTSSSSAGSTAWPRSGARNARDYVLRMAGLEARRTDDDAAALRRLEAAAGAGLRHSARAADPVSGRADLGRRSRSRGAISGT